MNFFFRQRRKKEKKESCSVFFSSGFLAWIRIYVSWYFFSFSFLFSIWKFLLLCVWLNQDLFVFIYFTPFFPFFPGPFRRKRWKKLYLYYVHGSSKSERLTNSKSERLLERLSTNKNRKKRIRQRHVKGPGNVHIH